MWMFWVYQLFPTRYNIDCSQLMSWFGGCQLHLVYLTMENHPTRNLQHETAKTAFDTFGQSQHRLHTLCRSFYIFTFQLHFLLSWNNKAYYPKNVLFSSIFNIKVATQKFTNFDVCFFFNAGWYDSCQYSLGKMLQIKLDNKVLLEPSYGKKINELFGQPNI